MSFRFDKYCWSVRLCKTRTIATEEINRGRIKLNENVVKASKEVKVNDIISVQKNNATFSYKILETIDKRLGPKLVATYLQDITPEEEKVKFATYISAQAVYRNYGTGKPSKKDRRNLDEFLDF